MRRETHMQGLIRSACAVALVAGLALVISVTIVPAWRADSRACASPIRIADDAAASESPKDTAPAKPTNDPETAPAKDGADHTAPKTSAPDDGAVKDDRGTSGDKQPETTDDAEAAGDEKKKPCLR